MCRVQPFYLFCNHDSDRRLFNRTMLVKGKIVKKMMLKMLSVLFFFSGQAIGGDVAEVANALKSAVSKTGNYGGAMNASGGKVDIKAKSTGSGSKATAGMVAHQSGGAGQTTNVGIAYNAGEAKIAAEAEQGGSAVAGFVAGTSN